MEINVLSILNQKTDEIITFNYFDKLENIRKIAHQIYNCEEIEDTLIEQFIIKRKEIYMKAYYKYMEKVRQDINYGIVETLYTKENQKINIMIFDEPNDIIEKYEKVLSKKLDLKTKRMILNNFNIKVEQIITNQIKQKIKEK